MIFTTGVTYTNIGTQWEHYQRNFQPQIFRSIHFKYNTTFRIEIDIKF